MIATNAARVKAGLPETLTTGVLVNDRITPPSHTGHTIVTGEPVRQTDHAIAVSGPGWDAPPFGLPDPLEMAIDTEYFGTHTLTVQAAARIDPDTIAVQVYRSAAVPDLPIGFDPGVYLPVTGAAYGRFCREVVVRPVLPLTPDLSPLTVVRDLFGLNGVTVVPRSKGWDPREKRGFQNGIFCWYPANARRSGRSKWYAVPEFWVRVVGHFLRADFGRTHGRDFLADLAAGNARERSRVAVRERKLHQFVEERGTRARPDPVLGYLRSGEDLFAVRVEMRDTTLPYGAGSLDSHSKTFLNVPKSNVLSLDDKKDMLKTFLTRTADAYGYSMVDPVNTLLVHEQMGARDREIYRAFGFAEEETPPLRPTLGGRVSTFLVNTTRRFAAAGSELLSSDRALKGLMAKGGVALFEEHPGASHYGPQTGGVHGALLYSRSPTKFCHESDGMLRDVDMAGCYNRITSGINVYWGRPVIFEPGARPLTLGQAVEWAAAHADRDAWLVRVSGDVGGHPNALIPSTEGAVTPGNYRRKRRAARRTFQIEARRDPASAKKSGGSRLYAARVESGVVTWATWLAIRAMPKALRERYERLNADSVILYPRKLVAADGPGYDALAERYRNDGLPWESALDLAAMEHVQREPIDADYVALKYPLGEFARRVGEFRREAQKRDGKGSGADLAWKQHANSMFGVLASRHLPTNNFVAANQVTAQARAEVFLIGQALNAIQTITDGCTYRRDQIPACTYAECLAKFPDYPIRRVEDGDGIPFLDPAGVPQDDAGFTGWLPGHLRRFYGVTGPEFDEAFGAIALEHKKTSAGKSVAFDALACDGCGNYVKAIRDGQGGWRAEDFAARAYGRESKRALEGWVLGTYTADTLTVPPPVTEDRVLLSFQRAGQKARKALLEAGVPEAYFPLGLEAVMVMNYRAIKPSAFVFETPEQRAAVLKQWHKFEAETGAGLEILSLRRAYAKRRKGSLTDVARAVYDLIRSGGTNLVKALNLNRASALKAAAAPRKTEIESRKAAAEQDLTGRIDARNIDPAALVIAFLLTADDLIAPDLVRQEA